MDFISDSHRIQTCNLLIRSQMLYSVELANHFCMGHLSRRDSLIPFAIAKVDIMCEISKFFTAIFLMSVIPDWKNFRQFRCACGRKVLFSSC